MYIEALDFEEHFIDLTFNQPNFKEYEQLDLLPLEALAALASNDLADEIEYRVSQKKVTDLIKDSVKN